MPTTPVEHDEWMADQREGLSKERRAAYVALGGVFVAFVLPTLYSSIQLTGQLSSVPPAVEQLKNANSIAAQQMAVMKDHQDHEDEALHSIEVQAHADHDEIVEMKTEQRAHGWESGK